MIKVEVVQAVSTNGKKYSKHTYLGTDGKFRTVDPLGKGRPPHTRVIDGVTGMLKTVTQYNPQGNIPAAVAKADRPEPVKTSFVGPKQTVLVYADGTKIVASGGRPRLSHNGHWLTEIQTWTPAAPVKNDIQEIKIEVQEDPHIAYVYGGKEIRKDAGKRGPAPLVHEGKPLEKIIRYVLSDNAPRPVEGEEEAKPTMTELGWVVGQKVKLTGSDKIATVVVVKDHHIGIQYPGSKFVDTFNHKRLERV